MFEKTMNESKKKFEKPGSFPFFFSPVIDLISLLNSQSTINQHLYHQKQVKTQCQNDKSIIT